MHPTILARNTALAMNRVNRAAHQLARSHGLKEEAHALETARHRDPGIDNLRKSEATADLLESVVRQLKAIENDADKRVKEADVEFAARISAIEGIGPKTMELIRAELGLPEPEPDAEPRARTSKK